MYACRISSMAGMLSDPIDGRFVCDKGITVEQYATQWLGGLSARLRPKTVRSYRELYRSHIGPALGSIEFGELRRAHVKQLLIEKKALGLSRNTVRLIRACVSSMCSEAVEDGIIGSNPAVSLMRWIVRTHRSNVSSQSSAVRPFSEADLSGILDVVRVVRPDYYPLFLTLARTGCRPGEALALRWPDVNFDRREILIERGFSAGLLGPTKTGKSRRVDMSQELATVLRGLQAHRMVDCQRRGLNDAAKWVFVDRFGEPIDENRPRKVFATVLQRAGIAGHTVYDLRHTFATLHLAKGHPITYVSAQLGHANPSTTLKWYAHWLPTSDKRFADSLDEAGRDEVAPTVG